MREENYELPTDAIREMIVNAHCHRNLKDEACVQVSIYDDRLEVSSPGGLYNGLTYEDIMHGRSRLRNRTLANVFNQMGLIEAWGTGIQRIQELAKEYNLPSPEFIDLQESFQVNLYRRSALASTTTIEDTTTTKTTTINPPTTTKTTTINSPTTIKGNTPTAEILIRVIRKNPKIKLSELALAAGITKDGVRYHIEKMRKEGILSRQGSAKSGSWILKD